jgi:hypothetical protein
MDDRKLPSVAVSVNEVVESKEFDKLLDAEIGDRPSSESQSNPAVVVGTLVGFTDNGATPLVTYRGQPTAAALAARTTVDVHAAHIARDVVLMFESGDPASPIITGIIRGSSDRTLSALPGRVEVDADGERLVVSANQGLVLRCGKASITLSADGRIVVRGTHVVSHSSGVNRIKGGSVQVN